MSFLKEFLAQPKLKLKFICFMLCFLGLGSILVTLLFGSESNANIIGILFHLGLAYGLYRQNNILKALALVFFSLLMMFLLFGLIAIFLDPSVSSLLETTLVVLMACFYSFSIFQLGFNKGVKQLFSDINLKTG